MEALAACAARIQADDARLGAFATPTLETAAAEARAAEAAWRAGEPTGPLCGVPVAVKDLFDTAGIETACGAEMLRGRVPERDAEAVRRVRAAGAVIVGKTRTHEFAWGLSMLGPDGEPVTRNPHDPERMPGGSSGGSAVAVATGMAALALGTDTGGSIRLPAAWCGIYGFKPTYGLVSLDGVWPLAPSLDHAGPMARTAPDAALLLGVLGGPPPAPPPAREPSVAGPEVLPDPARVYEVHHRLILSEALMVHRRAGLWPARAGEYNPSVRARLELAERLQPGEVEEARAERERLRVEVAGVFEDVDLVCSPVASTPPPRFEERVDLRVVAVPHLALQDVLGLPACALPDGTQLTGPQGADALVLGVAAM